MNHIIRHSYAASRDGQTVEELLRSQGYSKSLINRVKLTDDGLMIRGEKVYTTRRMQAGDRLDVALPEEASSEHIVPTPMPLSILYEDEDLMVINKAANVPIHPSQGNFSNSLANGLAWYFEQKQQSFVFRAINRLDRDTTGLLIVAKNALSSCILSNMVKNRQIHRTYLAAVSGDLSGQPEGTIDVRLPGFPVPPLSAFRIRFTENRSDPLSASLLPARDWHLASYDPPGNRTHPPDPCPHEIHRPPALRRFSLQPGLPLFAAAEPALLAAVFYTSCVEDPYGIYRPCTK